MGWAEAGRGWGERLGRSAVYDAIMRLPGAGWSLVLLGREVGGARDFIAGQADLRDPGFLIALASRAALISLLVVQAGCYLFRRRPVARPIGVVPRLIAIVGANISLTLLLLPRAPAAAPFDLASALLILAGNYLSLVALLRLGRSLSILPEGRRLVTDGPYRLVRHPLYVAEEIAVIGVFLQFRSWPAAAILVVHGAFQLLRMREEEIVLARAFPEYAPYRRRTALLIPGVL